MVTYSLVPHKVYEVTADGVAQLRAATDPTAVFSVKLGRAHARHLHGGPPLAYVPGDSTGEERGGRCFLRRAATPG
jgi:hypothetical protein